MRGIPRPRRQGLQIGSARPLAMFQSGPVYGRPAAALQLYGDGLQETLALPIMPRYLVWKGLGTTRAVLHTA